jgi:hypothetical protein
MTPDVNRTDTTPLLRMTVERFVSTPWNVRQDERGRITMLMRVIQPDYQQRESIMDLLSISSAVEALEMDDGAVVSDAVVASAPIERCAALLYAAWSSGAPRIDYGYMQIYAFRMVRNDNPLFLTVWNARNAEPNESTPCRCHARILERITDTVPCASYRIMNAADLDTLLRRFAFLVDYVGDTIRTGSRNAQDVSA